MNTSLLSGPSMENHDHIISIPETPSFCRICHNIGEETTVANPIIQIGCNCRGDISTAHQNCILIWFGRRMLLKEKDNCEICRAIAAPRVKQIVYCGLADHDPLLMEALAQGAIAEEEVMTDQELEAMLATGLQVHLSNVQQPTTIANQETSGWRSSFCDWVAVPFGVLLLLSFTWGWMIWSRLHH